MRPESAGEFLRTHLPLRTEMTILDNGLWKRGKFTRHGERFSTFLSENIRYPVTSKHVQTIEFYEPGALMHYKKRQDRKDSYQQDLQEFRRQVDAERLLEISVVAGIQSYDQYKRETDNPMSIQAYFEKHVLPVTPEIKEHKRVQEIMRGEG